MLSRARLDLTVPPVILFASLVSLTAVVVAVLHLGLLWTVDLRFLWYPIYFISLLAIVGKLRKGLLYEPIVILPSAYLFIIVIGSIVFRLIKDRSYDFYLSNFIGLGYFGLLAGIYLSQNFRYTIDLKNNKVLKNVYRVMGSRGLTYLAIIFCLMATLGLFAKGGIPMLAADVNQARIDLITGSGYLNIFFIGLTVFPLAFLYDCIMRKSRIRMMFSHMLAGSVFFLLLATGYRSRTLTFLTEYAAIYFFFNRRRFSLKLLTTLAIFVLTFLAVVGAYRRGAIDIPAVVKEVGIILVARPVMMELVVENFRESHRFYGSRYFTDMQKLLPGSQKGANVDLKYEVFPNAANMPEDAGVTPSIAGEAYMNFGLAGIFWVLFTLGILLGISYKAMSNNPTYLRCAFYFTFVIGTATAVSAGIGTRVVQLMFLWFWVVVSNVLYRWRFTV